jgi:uncharacterized protein (DUF2249 family)
VSATTTTDPSTLDMREVNPRERHATIFWTFDSLAPNESMEIVNDHDPQPLCLQFEARLRGRYHWEDLQAGPDLWRVRITKLAPRGHAAGTCCGACGGA